MGLLDIFNGGFNGGQPSASRVPPLAKGLAGLLAYGGLNKGIPGAAPGQSVDQQLEDIFRPAPDGSPTAKGVIGALLTGGLMDLVNQFRGAGHADTVNSWVERGPNRSVSANDLSQVLNEEQVAFLMQRTGLSRQELLDGLSERLPRVVDELTPDGRLPTRDEMQRRV